MAIKFEKIKPGMTLYDVRRNTGFDSYKRRWNHWPVNVVEVDEEKRMVLASWNNNKAEWMNERRVTKYRKNPPKE